MEGRKADHEGLMSRRVTVGVGIVLLVGLAIWSSVAWPDGNAGGHDGGTTISVNVGTSSSTPGIPGSPDRRRFQGGSGPVCTSQPVELSASAGFALPPGGPTPGGWYEVKCSGDGVESDQAEWIPDPSTAPVAARVLPVSPAAAADQAVASLVLPPPSAEVNPAAFSVVNLPTWLAVDPAIWHPYQATATVGGVTATAVATPETVIWSMGDGGLVECPGPGSLYNPALPQSEQSTSCAYTYQRSSEGEPSADGDPNDGAFAVTATVSWKVTWTAVGAPGGGILPSLHTATTVAVRVEQVESVGVVQ
jgi:hypothetical protein